MDARGSFPGDKAVGGVKLNTHLHLVSRTKNVWSYISIPPIRLHGVVLSQGHLYHASRGFHTNILCNQCMHAAIPPHPHKSWRRFERSVFNNTFPAAKWT